MCSSDLVRQYGTVGLDLTFEVENASRRTLRLEEAELEFFTGAGQMREAVAIKANIDHLLGITDERENKAQER